MEFPCQRKFYDKEYDEQIFPQLTKKAILPKDFKHCKDL